MNKHTARCYYPTADENRKQINAVFESRLPEIAGAVNKMAHFDDDLKQEALLGAYKALQIDPEAPKNYLLNNARWKMLSSKRRNVSVDSPRRECEDIMVLHFEDYELQMA